MSRPVKTAFAAVLMTALLNSCGVYTFSGSALPSYLKTVDIPQFINQSLEPNIADQVTQRLNQQIVSSNLLRVVSDHGDATITGKITSYSNTPYTFSSSSTRQVEVNQYDVRINADIEFTDNKKNRPLFKGTIAGEGVYDFQSQTESDGRDKAINQLVDRILQSSVQSW